MKLSRLLEIDKKYFNKGCRPNTLGDAYLRSHNSIYKRMMVAAQRSGFRFVEAWPEYYMLSLAQLDRILKTKEIPVISNRLCYAQLSKQMKGKCLIEEIPFPSQSYHLHESAHGIANYFLADIRCETKNKKVLRAMVSESFANATEMLSGMHVRDETHRWMLKLNCYIEGSIELQKVKRQIFRELGARNTVLLAFFAYLHANFLYEKVPVAFARKLVNSFGTGANLTAEQARAAAPILSEATQLNLGFRTNTSIFYFRSRNLLKDDKIDRLLDFDFMEIISKNRDWQNAIEKMVATLST